MPAKAGLTVAYLAAAVLRAAPTTHLISAAAAALQRGWTLKPLSDLRKSCTAASHVFAGQPNVLSLSRHVPSFSGGATRSVAQNEARKRRASERHVVGCCEELARPMGLH